MTRTQKQFVDASCELLAHLRGDTPLVQCLTNTVTTALVANAVLSVGASPAMVDIPGEAGVLAPVAGAVLINLGTPSSEQRLAMLEAAEAAASTGTPWVLDPVGVGSLPVRTQFAAELLRLRPTVVRGNASEIRALAGVGAGARGVDAVDGVDAAQEAAQQIARATGAVVAVSGPVDLITNGEATVRIANGTELFTFITGAGCALGGVIAAFLAAQRSHTDAPHDALTATVAACLMYAIAGESAAEHTPLPGSFEVALRDVLSQVTPEELKTKARVSA